MAIDYMDPSFLKGMTVGNNTWPKHRMIAPTYNKTRMARSYHHSAYTYLWTPRCVIVVPFVRVSGSGVHRKAE